MNGDANILNENVVHGAKTQHCLPLSSISKLAGVSSSFIRFPSYRNLRKTLSVPCCITQMDVYRVTNTPCHHSHAMQTTSTATLTEYC